MITRQDPKPPTAHEIRQIAVAAICCGATVRRYFAGLPVRSTSRARIDQALESLGLEIASCDPATDSKASVPTPEGCAE
jgi:hypothetical protein